MRPSFVDVMVSLRRHIETKQIEHTQLKPVTYKTKAGTQKSSVDAKERKDKIITVIPWQLNRVQTL